MQGKKKSKLNKIYYPLAKRMIIAVYVRYIFAPLLIFGLSIFEKLIRPEHFKIVFFISLIYLFINIANHLILKFAPGRKRIILDASLFFDVFFISCIILYTGGSTSPFMFLFYLMLIAATLTFSYRTGLKIAFLESAFFLLIFYQQNVGFIKELSTAAPGLKLFGKKIQFIGGGKIWQLEALFNISILWLISGFTTFFSAINEGELRRTNEELGLLHQTGLSFEKSLNLDEVFAVTLENVANALEFDKAVLFVVDEKERAIKGKLGKGLSKKETNVLRRLTIPLGQNSNILNKVISKKIPSRAEDLHKEAENGDFLKIMGEEADIACVPLIGHSSVEGIIAVGKTSKHLLNWKKISNRDIKTLLTLGNQAALAIINARFYEEAKKRAETDILTGLYNHRYFQQILQEKVERINRYSNLSPEKNPISLIMLDVDYFKNYNDLNGHVAGDKVLRKIGAIIYSSVRSLDTATRYGGEEFAIILPDCKKADAMETAERIRQKVFNSSFPHEERQPQGRVTVSLGVFTYDLGILHREEIVKRADKALYYSKEHGRNKVTVFKEDRAIKKSKGKKAS